MNFRKRRIQKPINKNAEKVRRERESQMRARLGDRYPTVESLRIDLQFFSPQGNLISERQDTYGANDSIDLAASCPGRCGDGRMDLEGKISDVIRNQQPFSEGRGHCTQPLYLGSNETCGCELVCRIQVAYKN